MIKERLIVSVHVRSSCKAKLQKPPGRLPEKLQCPGWKSALDSWGAKGCWAIGMAECLPGDCRGAGGPSTAMGPGTAALQVTEAAADARSELASIRPVVIFPDGWRNVQVLLTLQALRASGLRA